MKILFLTDNFPPEVNAPATRTYEHCLEWVKQGADVTVITCFPNFPVGKVYDGYKNKRIQHETIDGIKVIRVWTYISANEGFIKRIIDYNSFMMSAFFAGLTVKTDVIIATSPQFFTAIAGRWLSFWKRRPWIMEVRDLWPETITAVGAMNKRSMAIRFFEWLEKRMYKTAHRIVVVTDSFAKTLIEKHKVPADKIAVIKNGANLEMFQPIPKNQEILQKLGLENKKVVAYIGTHGMCQGLDFIVQSVAKIKDPSIHFLFIGSGAERKDVLDLKISLQVDNLTMLEAIPKHEVQQYTSIIDVGLVVLKKSDTFLSVIPSKIFELAAMRKPILHGVEGESAEIIRSYNIGITFEPENEEDFLNKLDQVIHSDPNHYGFDQLTDDFDRKKLAIRMLNFIENSLKK